MDPGPDRRGLKRAVAWLGVVASLGMFAVLVMGETVTTTGSAEGCGHDWPLCHGRFIPDFAVATAIEFSHRAVTGVEGILIVALTVGVLLLWRERRAVRVLAPLMLGALLLQAGMGAWAVKYPQQPVVLALHFGISLVALASVVLTAVYVWQVDRPGALPARIAPRAVRWVTWATALYVYLLVYSGAYIRHVGAAGACPGWPLCGSSPVATASGPAVNLVHRFAAALALLLAVGLAIGYRRLAAQRTDLVRGAWILVVCLVGQAASGAYLVLSHWGLGGELAHAAVTGITFTAIAYLCYRTVLGPQTEPAPAAPAVLHAQGVR